ncbi:MAG: hypothetical protein IPP71_02180 [Bacteroidetes bacterium]|nr:hypothetical protein [Bacteroidota bacterium]
MRKPTKGVQVPEQLRMENEIRKLKLQLEFGVGFHSIDPECPIPPHIEKIFLDNMEQFEKAHQAAKPVKVYDFIGNPQYRKAEALSESEISYELKRVKDILEKNWISCDSVYDTDDRSIYKFITEELFFHEIDDVRIPGLVLHIIYEEFHPNHECEIEEKCRTFFNVFLEKEFDTIFFDEEHEQENQDYLSDFRNSFVRFDIIEFQQESITIKEDKAEAVFKLDFSASLEGFGCKQEFSGYARIHLNCQYEWWHITRICLPGTKSE